MLALDDTWERHAFPAIVGGRYMQIRLKDGKTGISKITPEDFLTVAKLYGDEVGITAIYVQHGKDYALWNIQNIDVEATKMLNNLR